MTKQLPAGDLTSFAIGKTIEVGGERQTGIGDAWFVRGRLVRVVLREAVGAVNEIAEQTVRLTIAVGDDQRIKFNVPSGHFVTVRDENDIFG